MLTIDDVRHDALALPEAEEGTHFGLPSFEVRGKVFVNLQKGATHAIVFVPRPEAEGLTVERPEAFEAVWRSGTIFVGARVDLSRVGRGQFAEVVGHAWRHRAPRRLAAAHPEAGDHLPVTLGRPALQALTDAGYTTLGQLTDVTERELAAVHGVGPSALARLREVLGWTDRTFAAG